MTTSNHERVSKALQLLNTGLQPFVERELRGVYGKQWEATARTSLSEERRAGKRSQEINWDTTALLRIMWDQWHNVFERTLGQAERSLVSELRDTRNRWAHQRPFTLDDAYRTFDSIQRLLVAISAPEASELERHKQELLRVRFEEQARREQKKVATSPLGAPLLPGLRPWRDIITPHPDVASGRYQQAEFAADLAQVARGEGADEYRDPHAFFQRTFLTEGLRRLLKGALLRLVGDGGDPVVELQTNFGGGKTHSMLALYHLCSGIAPGELAGLESLLQEVGVDRLPPMRRVVLVGTALSPGQPHRKPDGTVVNTLWGEMAYQLLGTDGYALVAKADQTGVNPGSDVLRLLFDVASPCLILIDEWIAHVRQLYGKTDLPAGSFDANLTFAQSLTEAVRSVPHTLLVASLPASDIEVGGDGGREALSRLRNIFGRMESTWRPASTEEGFEIVRRRLFQPITDPKLFASRDAVVREFGQLYRTQHAEFPSDCRESDYMRRITAAYPIHPELFDRLYNDWSSLDKFQRTRGVLRLMATVIHCLWERQDRSYLILPASLPLDNSIVQSELTRYLDDPWKTVIEKDVDGPNALPLRIDRENPNLGRYVATRRVARTLFLGSAPTAQTTNKGLEDRQIKLGCVQPGETVSTFGDALRRLTDQATHLYQNGKRYWIATQPSVNRLAQDRALQQNEDDVQMEIIRRLRLACRERGDFAAVHVVGLSPTDIADEHDVRLVVLSPTMPHSAKDKTSPAQQAACHVLDWRGNSPRHYRNTVVFLAPDHTRLTELENATRQFLAWSSISRERTELNLDAFQENQAETKMKDAEQTIEQRIPETYCWLLTPTQPEPKGPVVWEELRLQGERELAVRAARRLSNDDLLLTQFGGVRLRMELDRIPLWRGNHVHIKQLIEDFAQYLYLPRLRDPQVLIGAIEQGISWIVPDETFAYAERYDPDTQRYSGLSNGQACRVVIDEESMLVQDIRSAAPETVEIQSDPSINVPEVVWYPSEANEQPLRESGTAPLSQATVTVESLAPAPQRYHGTVRIDPLRVSRDAGTIADAIVQHLSGLPGAHVTITLEIEAALPHGTTEHAERTVLENSKVLNFESFGFEEH
ncbi:MAG: ATP-binding protein [Chloroflexi bacterium AL-W]|nr:ATP-binding protein [Chloroflexi bacterium AL-N1]NOK68259.1 ATP-binding protein [Chloroflexi bacterium AL-N10]NOK73905.1 ATP-binding protein [Chloroflexi bacterium AL-N5]NOK82873.1 ATP-binding protein [Chloroflexi bacterium AL-W]NOK90395.1 ATP-binding protein [Chloroflexi bacterium AL-N15]